MIFFYNCVFKYSYKKGKQLSELNSTSSWLIYLKCIRVRRARTTNDPTCLSGCQVPYRAIVTRLAAALGSHNFLPVPHTIHKVLSSPLKPPAIPTHRHEGGCRPLPYSSTTAMAPIQDIDCELRRHCTSLPLSLSHSHSSDPFYFPTPDPAPSITNNSNMREWGSMTVR
jgi:hypothetical protein